MRILFPIILFIILGFCTEAQIVSVAISDKDSLLVGEEFSFTYRINTPTRSAIKSLNISTIDSLLDLNAAAKDTAAAPSYADFEITSFENWPINQQSFSPPDSMWKNTGDRFMLEIPMKGRIWDYGVFEFPGLQLDVDSMYADAILRVVKPRILVSPPQDYVHKDTTKMIAPIKTILLEEKTWADYLWIAYILLALLFLAASVYVYKKYFQQEEVIEEKEEIIIPAHVIAINKLDTLKSKNLWQQGKIKEYQSNLTYVAREYLENRYGVKALELTTDETLKALENVDFEGIYSEDLKQILTIADLVKFAKAKPGDDIHSSFMTKTYDLIENTKQDQIVTEEMLETLENQNEEIVEIREPEYAAFVSRTLALLIDIAIMSLIIAIVSYLVMAVIGDQMDSIDYSNSSENTFEKALSFLAGMTYFIFLQMIISWLYFAIMESKYGATYGKQIMGIQVVDEQMDFISFGKASLRYFGKILSAMILYVGFIMAGFTTKKQGLHDMISKTIVIKKESNNPNTV